SGSLISHVRSASSIQVPDAFTLSWLSRDGTCLMATTIFMRDPFPAAQDDPGGVRSVGKPLENQSTVGATEPEGVTQRIIHLHGTRLVRHIIEIAARIGILVVNRRGRDLLLQGANDDAGLESASATQKMAGHGLCRADGQFLRMVAERALHRHGFGLIA